MGYNIYRFTERVRYEDVLDEFGNKIWDDETDDWLKNEIIERDTLRINPYVIDVEDESYIDRAVTPGETYHYYYKLQGTNLKEYGISNTVSAVLNERLKGDVNLDGNVDIDDVNNTISHIKGETPDDFIESAADVNEDGVVDWADVVIIADIAGVTVGISDAERLNNKEQIINNKRSGMFDLQGRRVESSNFVGGDLQSPISKLKKGLYITNEKKVVVK